MELCQAIKDSNKLLVDAMSDMSKSFYFDGKDHENNYAVNGNDSTATITTTTTTFCGICLSTTNSSFCSLFSITSTAKTDYFIP